MNRAILVASAIALLPASAFAYINAGFKSQAEYEAYLRKQRSAKIGRATEAIRRDPKDAVAYFYRGNIHAESGSPGFPSGPPNLEAAFADFDKAIQLDPKFAQAYFQRGRIRSALAQQALKKLPAFEERQHLFSAQDLPFPVRRKRLLELEKTLQPKEDEALAAGEADVEKALQLDPKLKKALLYLALCTRDRAKAIQAAKQACEVTEYKDHLYVQLLASRYAKRGDFDNAVRWQEKAMKLPMPNDFLAKDRLEDYRHKKPKHNEVEFWFPLWKSP